MLYLVVFILLFLALIIYFLLNSKVKISLKYSRSGWTDHAVFSVYGFGGLIKYQYKVSLLEISNDGIKFFSVKKDKKGKEEEKKKKKKKAGFDEIYKKYVYIKERYHSNRHIINRIRKYLRCKIKLEEFDFCFILGTGDAYYTAILSGVVWALTGALCSLVLRNQELKKQHVDVKADFNQKRLNINLDCIFSIKLVHIIVVGFIILPYYLKRRWFNWQNIRYKVS
jgi:hypothetical protein